MRPSRLLQLQSPLSQLELPWPLLLGGDVRNEKPKTFLWRQLLSAGTVLLIQMFFGRFRKEENPQAQKDRCSSGSHEIIHASSD